LHNAKLVFAVEQLRKINVKVHKAMLGNLIPVSDFNKNFAKFEVEVALKKANLA